MTHVASPVRRRRLLLALTSALGGIAAAPSLAQTTPVIPTRASASDIKTGVGIDPLITSPNGNLNVRLRADNTVINWDGFNIPEGRTANFDNGTVLNNVAVLNRDVSGKASQLLGNLTSAEGVAVWVYNPKGIMVGAKATFTIGSLVLSALDVNSNDFLGGGTRYRMSTGNDGAGSIAGITVLNGATITTEGGNRGLVMVAPNIDADGEFKAAGQDVAFVTASDVTLNYGTNSPLSVTLNRGTAVPGRSQYVRGTVDGRDVMFALASRGTITDALLSIDAGVTTASNGRRGIVLSAGKPGTAVDGVDVAGTADTTGGVAGMLVRGVLSTASDNGGDIIARANGTGAFARSLISGRDVVLASAGDLTVAGDVTAGRDYLLTGQGIALGGNTSANQRAGRDVRLVSTDGGISGAAGLTLRSGGTASVTLSTVGTVSGDIVFDATSSLVGGSDRQGYVDLRQRDAANRISLGNVTARNVRQSIGTGALRDGLSSTGALTLGNVDVRDALALTASGITAGTLASDRNIILAANGAFTADAITARGGSVALSGSGTTRVDGTIRASGNDADVGVLRDGDITLDGLAATRFVKVDAGSGSATVAGSVGAGRDYEVLGSAVSLGGAGTVSQLANGAVSISAGAGGITGLDGLTLRSDANGSGAESLTLAVTAPSATGIAFAPGSSLYGGTARQAEIRVQLNDAASPIALGRVEARTLTGLTTTGALRLGDVSVVRDIVASGASIQTGALIASSGAVALTATAGAITTGSVDVGQSITMTGSDTIATGRMGARDAITIDGVGALTFGSDIRVDGPLTLRGGSIGFAGGIVRSGGAIDLRASSGGIVGTGAVALTSTSTQASDFVRLQATGVDGIALAPGSSITAGTDRALRVGIFNAAADAPLALGNVTARSLTALGAADGDATLPGGAIVSNATLTFGALDLVDSFAAESTGGNLGVAGLSVTGVGQGISLRAANGTLTVQNDLSASGDVTLASGGALRLGTVESRDGQATATSGGTVTLATLAGRSVASASGTAVTIDSVRGGVVALTASSGDVQVGRIDGAAVTAGATGGGVTIRNALAASGAVVLTATGDVRVGGPITSTGMTVGAQGDTALLGGLAARGDVALTGRSVTLGGAHGATGSYTVTSTAGGITGNAGTTLVADSDGQGGEALSLSATGGGIAFDPATTLRGGSGTSAVALVTDGGAIAVGDVAATIFTATGANSIRTGNLTLADSLTLNAAGDVVTGGIDAGGAVALTGATVAFGTVDAASLNATAGTGTLTGGTLTGGNVSVRGGASLQAAGAVTIGTVDAGNDVSLHGGTLQFGRVGAASLAATSAGALSGRDIVTSGAATLTAGGAIAVGTIDVGSLSAIAADGRFVAGDVSTGGAATIEATKGAINLGTVTTGGNLAITAGGQMFATRVASSGTATLTTTGLDSSILLANGLSAENSVVVAATGDIRASTIASRSGDLTIAAPNGELVGFDDQSGVALSAGPGRAFSLTIGDVARLGDVVGGKLTIVATSISAGRVDTGTEALELRATAGDLTLRGPATGGTVSLGASARTRLTTVNAGGALTLTGDSIEFTSIVGSSIDATSAGAITGNSATAASTLGIRGASIALDQVKAGSTLALTATNGDLTLTGPVTGGAVTLGASGRANLAGANATGALTLTGGSIGFNDIAGGSIDVASAGAVTGGSAKAEGALGVRGGTVTLGRADAGTTLTMAATGGDLLVTGPVVGRDVTLGASGLTSLANATATGALALTGGSIGFADIAGASIDVASAGAVTGGSANAVGALGVRGGTVTLGRAGAGTTLTMAATGGDLLLTGPIVGRDVTLGASGRTSLTNATATGALTLTGGSIGFADVTGASIDASSSGAIIGNAATASGALGLRGATLALRQAVTGGTAALAATGGDLQLTGLTSGGDATLSATGIATISGVVAAGGAYRVTGGSVLLGGTDIVQKAAGEVRITATSGDMTGAQGLTLTSDSDGTGAERLLLDAAGGIGFAGTRIQAGANNGAVLGLRAGGGRTMQFGIVGAARIGSFDGTTVAGSLSHDAGVSADDVAVTDLSAALSRGDLTFDKVAASGNLALRTDTGKIALGDVRGADITLASGGALTTAAVTSTGATSLKGESIEVAGKLAVARQLLADARAALTLRDASAGGAATLKAGGALVAGTVEGASIDASGAGVTLASVKAGDALTLTSRNDLSLGGGTVGGAAVLDVVGLATIGGLAGGTASTITAGDVALNGPVRAQTVAFVNRAPTTATMRIGDGLAADGFRLSDAEVRQVTADTMRFDAGTGGMEVGTLTLGTGSGRAVEMLGTGDIRVVGTVSTQGSDRSVRIGGNLSGGNANAIHVIATRDGGGRLLFDGSDVQLRGTRIAVGLAPGFIDTLQPGAEGLAQAQSLIGNGNSALYNPQLGGGFYDPGATTTLSARSLTVSFGDYALFQNTAIPGQFSGLKLGGTPAAPVSPALRISTFGAPAQASVALFGTINGIDGASAALLGNPVINIDPVLLPNSRINGCLAGSGAGCINTIVIQPTLQVFDWNSEEVFGIARDVSVPFAPVIGSNNEELLTDLPALAPQSPTDQEGER
ncbi:filamentous hemagglutinin N-terminal domain-containing protein [Sphingomonas faeni]|uniref:two-partner secretion domain-containing protein n=1 Tax=Sphingomonas faeni TaxID=185950 RepID=UPI00334BBD28